MTTTDAKPVVIHDDERSYVDDYVAKRSHLDPETGCVEWAGTVNVHGRAIANLPRRGAAHRNYYAYRVAWTLAHGPIPDGMFLCHKCDNPLCINVDHLFIGTAKENCDDMMRKGRNSPIVPRYGLDHHAAVAPDQFVQQVRDLWATGKFESYAQLGRELNVNRATVRAWVLGVNRRTVKPVPGVGRRAA